MNSTISIQTGQSTVLLEPITVRELSNRNYFIPDYQRGYRWTATQVVQMLEDIYNFESIQLENKENTWYCLQPLVVKKMESFPETFEGDKSLEWMEVIDGQQRLTTVFLIIHYINEIFRGVKKDNEPTILYQTRKGSKEFLTQLNSKCLVEKSNVDYYHMSSAYQTIHKWFGEKNINQDTFISKFFDLTKVIWYQTFEKNSIKIFTRINTGKIQLTNAELVKALFLNSSNFNGDEIIYHKQLQISSDWENIEYSLQNNDFWEFLNKEHNDTSTRIEFLLDLIKKKDKDNKFEHYTFSQYFNDFKGKEESYVFSKWYEIKQTFLILSEWFNDPTLHNKIGFLIYCDQYEYTLSEILDKYKTSTKSDFERILNAGISAFIKTSNIDLEKIEYRNNQSLLRKILLLHNIETMNQNQSNDSKFPFRKFKDKNNGWDIEHIGSIAEKIPELEVHRKLWIEEAKNFILDTSLKARCESWNTDTFTDLFYDIVGYFEGNGSKTEDTTNFLGNLALLDSKTNRGYKNAVFPEKRNQIIEKDKKGQFIPICTKNIFMKYYSTNTDHLYFWTHQDRADYLKNIVDTLSIYTHEQ